MGRHSRVLCLSLAFATIADLAAADAQRRLEAGRSELESGDHAEAAVEFERGLAEAREDGDPASLVFVLCAELADVYTTYPDLGRESDAEPLLLEARGIAEATLPAGNGNRLALLQRLGQFYYIQDRRPEAIPVLEQYMEEGAVSIPPERLYSSQESSMLRDAYGAAGDSEAVARLDRLRNDPTSRRALPSEQVAAIDPTALYVEANARAADGTPITVHFDPALVPLRVSVGLPDTPAAGGTPEQTRAVAIEGMREWERAIREIRPDFRLEFESETPSAPIQVIWSDRPPNYVAGSARMIAVEKDGALQVTAQVILSAKPLPGRGEQLGPGDVRIHATHAFGGALGLGYCWECDSIRSMGWRHRDALLPTDLDLRTLEALWAVPNGTRSGEATAARGVLADLPFINTGDDRHIFVDLAKPGSAPFVAQLDTGANTGFMTPIYARALGVATRAAKSDPHRRDTVTGKPVLFWVTDQAAVSFGDSGMSYALIGGEYLEDYVVEVDFVGRRVRLLDPAIHRVGADPPDRPTEQVIDMPLNEVRPYVSISIGSGSVLALVDTGSTGSISTSQEVAETLGIAVDPDAPRRTWTNVVATSIASVQRLPVAKLGPVTLHDVEIDIGLRGEGGVRIERTLRGETLIGQHLLRDFVVRFDYPRRKLGLTPVAPRKPQEKSG